MNNLSKQYVKNVKTFFPVIGKKEKEYLKHLEIHIDSFCIDNSVSSLEDLYENFGTPAQIVNTYYETIDTEYVLHQIKKSHYIKICISIIVASFLIATSIYCTISYRSQKIFEQEQIFSEDYILE